MNNIATWVLVWLLIGIILGYFLAGVLLVFFGNEIFDWIDKRRDYVRRKMGLN